MTELHDLANTNEPVAPPCRRSGLVLFCALLLLAPALGCRGNGQVVEDHLRQRENDVRELREELYRTVAENEALKRQVGDFYQHPAAPVSPELASQSYTLRSIVLGRQTGGYDEDGKPGDEMLQVVLEPRDADGHSIKAPGTVQIQALSILPEGTKKPLSSWQITPDQLHTTWRNGFLTSAYFLKLPWKTFPCTEKVRVIVQFTLPDGRTFEADKDVTVRLLPEQQRKMPPADGPELDTPLPLPRKLDIQPVEEPRGGPGLMGVRRGGSTEPPAVMQTSARGHSAAEILPPSGLR